MSVISPFGPNAAAFARTRADHAVQMPFAAVSIRDRAERETVAPERETVTPAQMPFSGLSIPS